MKLETLVVTLTFCVFTEGQITHHLLYGQTCYSVGTLEWFQGCSAWQNNGKVSLQLSLSRAY